MWFSFNFFKSVWNNPVAPPFTTFLAKSLGLQETEFETAGLPSQYGSFNSGVDFEAGYHSVAPLTLRATQFT